jgi:phosphoribosylaminoimidazole-succinocarboxamide synthase
MLVKKVSIVPFECIVRGYLTGSGWKEFQKSGTVNGQPLRAGYQNGSKLDAVLFTPSTKAELGEHDLPVTLAELSAALGAAQAQALAEASIRCYSVAADYAAQNGIIIADTKFEFGVDEAGQLVLADEVLTPDSSRFWPQESYAVGSNPPSLDKQYVRDWLDSVRFNHQPPAPVLPDDVVAKTREKYVEAFEKLTKKQFA